jgi:hypothetical protein
MGLLFLFCLFALALGDAETCGTNQEIKLFRTGNYASCFFFFFLFFCFLFFERLLFPELGAASESKHILYLNDVSGDDENYILVSTNNGVLM